jgi:SulP family sulfate permease
VSDSASQTSERRAAIKNAVPIFRWLPEYKRSRLRGDILAGAIVAALLIPQSLGYARIAGVPVQIGLYAVPLALLAYAVLGSSPQLIVGPASTVAIVSGSLVADIARDNPEDAVAITSALAIATGIALVASGLLRIAWIAEFLSRPIVTGFVFGLTLTIVIGELPTLLGIPKPPGDLIGVLIRTIQNIGDTDVRTAIVSGASLLLLFGGRQIAPRVPWGLVVLVAGVGASTVLDLEAEGVAVIGDVPGGLPPLGLPLIPQDDLGAVVIGGISLALVALAEGLAATRLFATRGDYRVATESELVGMGASNIAAGLSGGLAVAGSLSKTAAADQAGSRSQVTGLTSAALVIVVLIAFTWFFTDLPQAVLSAIVIAAVWGLMDIAALRRYRRVRQADFVAAAVGIGGVVLFGPLTGLGIAIVVSLLAIIYRSSSPRIEVLGKIGDEKAAWGRVRGHPDRRPVRGVIVVRLDAPLFWANATAIEDRLLAEVEKWPETRALVLDLEATTQLDTTAADVLAHLRSELDRRDVSLYLARVLHRVEAVLDRSGFFVDVGRDHMWHSISQCVRAARKHTGLKGDDGAATEPVVEAATISDAPQRSAQDVTDDDQDVTDDEVEILDDESDDTDEDLYAGGPPPGESKLDNAVNLYLHGIRDGHPREAIAAYAGDRYTQHSTGVRDGPGGFVEFFEPFVERNPRRYIRVLRTIEDAPYVFLHVFQSLDNGERQWVTTDFFDTDSDDLLVEHWDVISPYSASSPFGHTAIDGPTAVTDLARTEENKVLVREMIEQVLMPGGDRTRVDGFFSDRCIEHGIERSEGCPSIREFATSEHKRFVYDEIVLLVGQGSFVATLCKVRRGDQPYAQVDIFRLEYGRIVEHWDNAEVVPPDDECVNSGKF